MLLLTDEFASVAEVTDELSMALAEGRDGDSLSLLMDLGDQGKIGLLLLAWADLLTLSLGPSGNVVFGHTRKTAPETSWLPYAEAIVDGVAAPGRKQGLSACVTAVQDLDDPEIFGMLGVMARLVREALDTAGGLQRLLNCCALHHAFVTVGLTARNESW